MFKRQIEWREERKKYIVILSENDLGCVQEQHWYESEIQTALLDKFIQHLEKSDSEFDHHRHFCLPHIYIYSVLISTHHGINISSVQTVAVHAKSFYVLLVLGTYGGDNQG